MGHSQSIEQTQTKKSTTQHRQRRNSSSKTLPVTYKEKENEGTTRTKRFTRLGTIRRKLAKSLKAGKSSDFRKHVRELLQSWPLKEIQSLVRHYEGLEALKKLSVLSDAAQPAINSLEEDLLALLTTNTCTDLVIEYNGETYNLHKSIVCCRCRFFAKYVSAYKSENDVIKFEIPGLLLDKYTFTALLSFIYSGQTEDSSLLDVLSELGDKFGMLNPVVSDIKTLLYSENYTDVVLVYPKNSSGVAQTLDGFSHSEGSLDTTLEIPVHSALLSARSKFFCNLLSKKFADRINPKERLKIVLNEKIIPRCFIRVLLTCIYTDQVDLSTAIKWKVADDGSCEAYRLLTTCELAMELFEIGQFLEISSLEQGVFCVICFGTINF